jgi:hypothetical protein
MLGKLNSPITAELRWRGPDLDVTMANDWCCNNCLKPLRPSAVRREPAGAIVLICENCHDELFRVELGG